MFKINTLTIFLILLSSVKIHVQEKEKVLNENGWYMYSGNHKIAEKWNLHTLIHVRRSNIITHWQQSLNRIGMNYHIIGKVKFSTS